MRMPSPIYSSVLWSTCEQRLRIGLIANYTKWQRQPENKKIKKSNAHTSRMAIERYHGNFWHVFRHSWSSFSGDLANGLRDGILAHNTETATIMHLLFATVAFLARSANMQQLLLVIVTRKWVKSIKIIALRSITAHTIRQHTQREIPETCPQRVYPSNGRLNALYLHHVKMDSNYFSTEN